MSNSTFDVMISRLISNGVIAESGPIIYQIDHKIVFSAKQQKGIERLLNNFRESPQAPPTIKECIASVGEEVFSALLELEILISVSNEVVFRTEDYDRMVDELIDIFSEKETLSAAEVRDHFHTSRKYALAFLEYMDSIRITIRDGDVRRLRRKSRNQ